MPRSATAVPAPRRCPQCTAAFDCGAGAQRGAATEAEPFACWCAALPPLVDPAGPCLCPECLAGALARQAAGRVGKGQGDPTE
ncbi:MAG: hypothetical protein GAK41_00647 [Burkholderia gladioli]|nr:MAG: hypothetical protein GAK41_00647 [Burkholderia gladioli]